MGKVKLGFIGAGVRAQLLHMASYREIEGCELVALSDDRVRSAQVAAQKYGIGKIYRDYSEMLDKEKPDGVVVSTDFRSHHILLPDVIKRGIPVLADIPIAASVETAERLVEMADKAEAPCHLGYIRKFDPAVEMAKKTVEDWRRSGECGRITYVRITMPFREWPYGRTTGETFGITPEPIPDYVSPGLESLYLRFITFYIGQINLLRYLIGEGIRVDYIDPNDALVVMISESGVTCSLEMAQYGLRNRWEEFYKICFEDGKIDLKLAAPLSKDASDILIYRGKSGEFLRPDLPRYPAAVRMAEHFINSILFETQPLSTFKDGLRDLIAAERYITRSRKRDIGTSRRNAL